MRHEKHVGRERFFCMECGRLVWRRPSFPPAAQLCAGCSVISEMRLHLSEGQLGRLRDRFLAEGLIGDDDF